MPEKNVICKIIATAQLKKFFPELTCVSDYVCIPLFDAVYEKFCNEINKTDNPYDVTDICYDDGSQKYSMHGSSHSYTLVIKGKIVKLTVREKNLDNYREDSDFIWQKDLVEFAGRESLTQNLCNQFIDFIKQQRLEELREAASKKLQEKKTHHLAPELQSYFDLV
ncbi:MAG: hypothetical protein WCW02_02180 [Candidatus Buchananbacteria bacterium]